MPLRSPLPRPRTAFLASFTLLFLASTPAYAATVVPAGPLATQTWSAAGSPYLVQGDVDVSPGATLTIDQGTVIQATAGVFVQFNVSGTILVNGTAASPVVFTSTSPAKGSWAGLAVGGNVPASAAIHHVFIDGAAEALTVYGLSWDVMVDNAVLTGSNYGLGLTNASGTFDAITISGNDHGLRCGLGPYPASFTLTNGVIVGNGSGVHVQYGEYPNRPITIESSTIQGNGSFGVEAYGAYAGNVQGPLWPTTITVRNSLITGQTTGIYNSVTDPVTFDISYSDLWNNVDDFAGKPVVPGPGVLSVDPHYVAAPGDTALLPGSPCIDAGDSAGAPTHDRNGRPRPYGAQTDMGAYELGLPTCGDSVPDPGEACDDGALNGTYDHCSSSCDGPGPRCGDGVINGVEACDDGNNVNGDGCASSCAVEVIGTTSSSGGSTASATVGVGGSGGGSTASATVGVGGSGGGSATSSATGAGGASSASSASSSSVGVGGSGAGGAGGAGSAGSASVSSSGSATASASGAGGGSSATVGVGGSGGADTTVSASSAGGGVTVSASVGSSSGSATGSASGVGGGTSTSVAVGAGGDVSSTATSTSGAGGGGLPGGGGGCTWTATSEAPNGAAVALLGLGLIGGLRRRRVVRQAQ